MTKIRRAGYSATRARQGVIALKGPLQLAVFTANLFGSMALLMTALWLHL